VFVFFFDILVAVQLFVARDEFLGPNPLIGCNPSINPSNDSTKKSATPAFLAPQWADNLPNNSTDFTPLKVEAASNDSILIMSGDMFPSIINQW
jgi:hypothetical protein